MFQVVSREPFRREVLHSGSFDDCQSFARAHQLNNGLMSCHVEHSRSDEPSPSLCELLGQNCIEIGQELLSEHYGSPERVFAALVARVVRGLPQDLRENFFDEIAECDPMAEKLLESDS
jgi:hypothetical protein